MSTEDMIVDIHRQAFEQTALLTEIRDRLPAPKQPRAQVGIPTSNPVKVTVSREPVGVTEEPPACVCGSVDGFDCCADPAPADVDPDEALASEVLYTQDEVDRQIRAARERADTGRAAAWDEVVRRLGLTSTEATAEITLLASVLRRLDDLKAAEKKARLYETLQADVRHESTHALSAVVRASHQRVLNRDNERAMQS